MQAPTIQALITPPTVTSRPSRGRVLAYRAIWGQLAFAGLSVIGGLVRHDYSIRRQTISELAAHGPITLPPTKPLGPQTAQPAAAARIH